VPLLPAGAGAALELPSDTPFAPGWACNISCYDLAYVLVWQREQTGFRVLVRVGVIEKSRCACLLLPRAKLTQDLLYLA
jgi:hypothetical protein